jgi:hypothetical protein
MAPELRVHLNSNGSRTSRTSTNIDNRGALTFRLSGNRKQSRELVRFDRLAALLCRHPVDVVGMTREQRPE